MLVRLASTPGNADRPNEDFTAASPTAVVLVDGAGVPIHKETGCSHGVAWYARTLATAYLAEIGRSDGGDLVDGLAHAIEYVRSQHVGACDLDHPDTPSATVIAVRRGEDELEYLVLADSVLVLDRDGRSPEVITDGRLAEVNRELRRPMEALPGGSPERADAYRHYLKALAAHRNAPDGFWVAGAAPKAAMQALTGTVPLTGLTAFALLSDGASRLVDSFHLADWAQLLRIVAEHGPAEVIERVRAAEHSDPDGDRWPRAKVHDDATVAYCLL